MSFDVGGDKARKRDRFFNFADDPFGLFSSSGKNTARDPLGIFEAPEKIKIPKAPTIDEAGKSRDEFDRIRRRRGILATIFSKNASSTPAVATQQLLG